MDQPLRTTSSPSDSWYPGAHTTPPRQAEVEALGERIALLAAQLAAATYELLVMLREFDERGGWGRGFRSCAHWLNWRTGLDLGAAREKVRVAHALAELPLLSSAMTRGELSYSKVRALTRIATPRNEGELLIFAVAGTASHVEKLVRSYRHVERLADPERERRRHEGRYLRTWVDDDGMVVVQARLSAEVGAVLVKALDAAAQELFGAAKLGPAQRRDAAGDTTAEQRRADALGLVAESALAGALDAGTRGDRYQVVVHVTGGDLVNASGATAPADLPALAITPPTLDGSGVSAETCRRLACDGAVITMTHDAQGNVLDVGRRTRAVSPALHRALRRRDGGCRFPGCGLALCDAHHVEHWADGGETRLDNLVQLCRFHHRAVHEDGFRVELLATGEARFYRADGRLLEQAPGLPGCNGNSLQSIPARLESTGRGDVVGPVPSWNGGSVDYGWAVDCLRSFLS